MSDDKPTRRTEEPAPGIDPGAVPQPAPVVESREIPVAVTHEAPAESAEPEGPAHRADAPVDGGRAAEDAPLPTEDPRAEVEPDRDAEQRDEATTPPVAAMPAGQFRDEQAARTDRLEQPAPPVAAVPVDRAPEERADTEQARSELVSPAEQPTTEAPRLARARAAAVPDQPSAAEPSVAAAPPIPEPAEERTEVERPTEERRPDGAPAAVPVGDRDERRTEDDSRTPDEDTAGIRDARPAEAHARGIVSAPAEAPAPPPIPAPTAPVETAGEAPVAAAPAQRALFLDAPVAPRKKNNRGFGILMSVLAALVFALVWAGVSALIIAVNSTEDRFTGSFMSFLASPVYWGPVIVFLIGMILLALIVNRGGWAWWLIGGFVVAVAVYLGYLGSALLTVAQRITPNEVQGFVSANALSPLAIASGVIAREVSIWFGLATSARGRKVKARNADARAAYERESADYRAEVERARAGTAD